MREILLKFDERVFKDLKNALGLSIMADSGGGLSDAVLNKIVASLIEGEKEVLLKYKGEK